MASPSEYPGAPRWVKAVAVLALVALAIVVGVHLLGGGGLAHMIDHGSMGHSHDTP